MARSTHTTEPEPRIAVAIITYQRPEQLRDVLCGVLRELETLTVGGRVIVVDNDPGLSAHHVVARWESQSVDYIHEPTPGIAAARNRALDVASDCRLLAFIDDDESPQDGWLQALVDAWREWGCDGVAGPNLRELPADADAWVQLCGFFDPPERPDGATMRGAATSNLLLDLDTIRRLDLRFDDRFGTTGGSDTLFTRQLSSQGGVIRWCARAVTTEPVPETRANRRWILARDRRVGNTWSRVHLTLANGFARTAATAVWLIAIAGKLMLLGFAKVGTGLLTRNLRARSRGERDVARAVGLLLGLVGSTIEEYRRT